MSELWLADRFFPSAGRVGAASAHTTKASILRLASFSVCAKVGYVGISPGSMQIRFGTHRAWFGLSLAGEDKRTVSRRSPGSMGYAVTAGFATYQALLVFLWGSSPAIFGGSPSNPWRSFSDLGLLLSCAFQGYAGFFPREVLGGARRVLGGLRQKKKKIPPTG